MYGPMDAALVLRDVADGAETATATETAIPLDLAAAGDFKAVFHISALKRTAGNETYVLSVEVAAAADFSDAVVIGALPGITATGCYEMPLSGELVRQHRPTASRIRCKATLGGTAPSVVYGCHLTPAF